MRGLTDTDKLEDLLKNESYKGISININDLNDIDAYLSTLGKVNFMTEEEERKILSQKKNGNIVARDKFVKAYYPLVISIAKKYFYEGIKRGFRPIDLIEEGNLGLVKAADKYKGYDISKGSKKRKRVRFMTYAHPAITRTIQAMLIEGRGPLALTRNLHSELFGFRKFLAKSGKGRNQEDLDKLIAQYGRLVGKKDIDLFKEKIKKGIEADRQTALKTSSFDVGSREFNGYEIEDESPSPYEQSYRNELSDCVRKILDLMEWKFSLVLELNYGLNGITMSYTEIGNILGITREGVRQIREKAEKKFKDLLAFDNLKKLARRIRA